MGFESLRNQVVDAGLCCACGLCAGVCPVGVISMAESGVPELTGKCVKCDFCNRCCPGRDLNLPRLSEQLFSRPYDVTSLQGYVRKQYVGYATDSAIRLAGASGGMVTAMLCFLLEQGVIDGAVVAAMHEEKPWTTVGKLACTTEEIRLAAQSKYCLTPSLAALSELRNRKGKFAVAALPCQVAGLRKLAAVDPGLSGKISCIMGLYCNCNVLRHGHVELLDACGVARSDIRRFHFRTGAWPGGMGVELSDGKIKQLHEVGLTTVLNVLFRLYTPKRCALCVDALSEYADLSFGDFWAFDYQGEFAQLEHANLISCRTATGSKFLKMAARFGAVTLTELPQERKSKRIENMARGKKMRAAARLFRLARQGRPTVDYHVNWPAPDRKARRTLLLYDLWRPFKVPLLRRLMLRLLISPFAVRLEKINQIRKKHLYSFQETGESS